MPAVSVDSCRDGRRTDRRTAIAAVQDRSIGAAIKALLANVTVAHQQAVGTDGAIVVQRMHDRAAVPLANLKNRWAEQRKEVVDVDKIGPLPTQRVRDQANATSTSSDRYSDRDLRRKCLNFIV